MKLRPSPGTCFIFLFEPALGFNLHTSPPLGHVSGARLSARATPTGPVAKIEGIFGWLTSSALFQRRARAYSKLGCRSLKETYTQWTCIRTPSNASKLQCPQIARELDGFPVSLKVNMLRLVARALRKPVAKPCLASVGVDTAEIWPSEYFPYT